MKTSVKFLVIAMSALPLLGCGGGGGGTSATLASFTNWNSVLGQEFVAEGISTSGTYAYNTSTQRVTSRGGESPPSSGASYTAKYTSQGRLEYAKITSATGEVVNFSRAAGDDFEDYDVIDAAISSDGTRQAIAASPTYASWDYQSFGVWMTGVGTSTGTYGAISIGAPTAGASIPTSSTANFSGYSMGLHIDGSGNSSFIVASMTANANFANRSVVFQTTNTNAVSLANGTTTAKSSLDLNGTLTYQAATNSISGALSTTSVLTPTEN